MRKLFIAFISLLFAISAAAQSKTITVSGTVVDEKGEELIGANVVIKNQPGVGVKTNIDGKFTLKTGIGDYLVFSYMGYQSLEYQVLKEEKDIRIQLQPDDKTLETVTVFGQTAQRKVSVVGAISSVEVKQLEAPATSINNMLAGRVAGIISMQTSGEPGKNVSEFWVRGIGTFGVGNKALILIDGLEGSLDQIDPADVESFSVLKDASATAVYGVRGANGVVLITTKRGKEGKLMITARANYTVSQLKRLPQYLRAYDYANLANEASVTSGGPVLYSPMQMKLIQNKLEVDLLPDVNWQKEILQPVSLQQTYYLNASGGGSIARYFISTGYSNESAAYKQDPASKFKNGVGYQKITYRSNIDVNLTKSTKLYLGMDGYVTMSSSPGMTNTGYLWSAARMLTPLIFPTRYSTGQLPTSGRENMFSPYTMLNETGFSNETHNRTLVTLAVTQDLAMLTKGLTARVQVATDNESWLQERRYLLPDMYTATGRYSDATLQLAKTIFAQKVFYMRNTSLWRKYFMETQINWNRDFADHNVGAMLYHYLSDAIDTKNVAIDNTGIGNIPFRYQGLSGRLTYGYKNTYFADANFGFTGSANFPTGMQYGFFPSVAFGWVATEYPFMREKLPWLSFLKFRYSYGMAGNDKITDARFPYLTKVDNLAPTTWGYRDAGFSITQNGANNLRWETSIKQDLGVDGKLFKDNLSFTVDFFRDTRDNIFQQKKTIPEVSGFVTNPFGNVGSMYSYGTDGNISYFHKLNKDMDFTVRGNYTYAANYVKHYDEAIQPYAYLNNTGYPWDVQRGYIALGLFKDEQDIQNSPVQSFGTLVRPGDIKYKDVNGDGKITELDQVPLTYANNAPRLMYGFGGEFRYKSFTAGVMFRGTGAVKYFHTGTKDGYGILYDAGWIPFVEGKFGNVLSIFKDPNIYWSEANPNPNAQFPRLSYGNNQNNSQRSTFWMADGSYIRLQEVTLSYKLGSKKFMKPIGITSIEIQAVANNLFTIDKVKYFDPEQAQWNGGQYPIPARYSLQFYVNF